MYSGKKDGFFEILYQRLFSLKVYLHVCWSFLKQRRNAPRVGARCRDTRGTTWLMSSCSRACDFDADWNRLIFRFHDWVSGDTPQCLGWILLTFPRDEFPDWFPEFPFLGNEFVILVKWGAFFPEENFSSPCILWSLLRSRCLQIFGPTPNKIPHKLLIWMNLGCFESWSLIRPIFESCNFSFFFVSSKEVSINLQLGGGNSNILLFSPQKLGKIPLLTHIFLRGWNHQLVNRFMFHPTFCRAQMSCLSHGFLVNQGDAQKAKLHKKTLSISRIYDISKNVKILLNRLLNDEVHSAKIQIKKSLQKPHSCLGFPEDFCWNQKDINHEFPANSEPSF